LGDEILDADERRRLAAFRSQPARRQFLSGRTGVRMAASAYGPTTPSGVGIRCDVDGKPRIVVPEDLHFSISHSGECVLAAFSRAPVGLDYEQSGRSRNFEAVARRFFQPDEAGEVLGAGAESEAVFLKIWTAKEAIVKLVGAGLANGLEKARTTPDGGGFWGEREVCLLPFVGEDGIGTVASFEPFVVKDWFDL